MLNGNLPFFITLVTGLLIAFAIQFFLSILSVAIGITSADHLFTQRRTAPDAIADSKAKKTNLPFSLGFCILAITNVALFTACFLAVRLSSVTTLDLGAILGVVIWSAYLIAIIWLSSIVFRSVLGSTVKLLDWGWQSLRSITGKLFGKDQANASIDLNLNLQDDLVYLLQEEAGGLQSLVTGKNKADYADLKVLISDKLQNLEEVTSNGELDQQNKLIGLFLKYLQKEISQEKPEHSSLPEVIKKLSNQLEQVRDRLMGERVSSQQAAIAEAQELWSKLLDYLSERGTEINTASLQAQLQALYEDANKEFDIHANLPNFERKAVKQALKKRQELSKKQVNQTCDRVEKVWNTFLLQIEDHSVDTEEEPTSAINEILEGLQKYLTDFDWDVLREEFLEKLKQPQIAAIFPLIATQIDWGSIVKQIPVIEEAATAPVRQLATQMYETASNAGDASQQWVVDKVQQLQHGTHQQVNAISQQTRQQLKATQQTTVTSLWWLVAIAFSSLLTSAIAGGLAVAI